VNNPEKFNLLIVDDKPENLYALENILEEPDIHIFKALSGDEALELALENELALIITDVMMPGMDGYELAELLRGKAETLHTPIIFVTAVVTEQKFVFKGYESGAVDYLVKPIEPAVLKSKVRVFVDLFRQKQIIQRQANELEKNITQLNQAMSKLEIKEKEQKKLIEELQKALDEVKTLSGLIPICAKCKKIRDDNGYWNELEAYITSRSEAQFSHGLCPTCFDVMCRESHI